MWFDFFVFFFFCCSPPISRHINTGCTTDTESVANDVAAAPNISAVIVEAEPSFNRKQSPAM